MTIERVARIEDRKQFVEDLSEKEQIDKFREWWSDNGNFVIAGVVLGIAIMVGISQWRTRTAANQVAASSSYEALMTEVGSGNLEAAEAIATEMYGEHAGSVYSDQARLAMARLYMDKSRDQDAADALRGVLDDDDDELARVARLRLAKVLLYQNRPQDVVDLLEGRIDGAFAARYSETLGDAYVALGRHADAADAYEVALSDGERAPTIDQALVRWKLIDLPDPAETGDAEVPPEDAPGEDETPNGESSE